MVATMDQELEALLGKLAGARGAEEVFGALSGTREEMLAGVRGVYRRMALVAHPDRHVAGKEAAERAFRLLETWRERAERRIAEGVYGKGAAEAWFEMVARKGRYRVAARGAAGDYFTLHGCRQEGRAGALVLKVVGEARDNDLLENEVEVLGRLAREAAGARAYVPKVVESMVVAEGGAGRRAAVLAGADGMGDVYRMTEIRRASPLGLEARDAAWMFNRVLEGLWHVHGAGWVHGAVVPENLWVDVAQHGVILSEYGYAVEAGRVPVAVSGGWRGWYPAEVLGKSAAGFGTDIFMAARCLAYVLGGDVTTGVLPSGVPGAIGRFVRGCMVASPARRPTDAGALREEFDDVLAGLYGRRVFRPLAMPAGAEPVFGFAGEFTF